MRVRVVAVFFVICGLGVSLAEDARAQVLGNPTEVIATGVSYHVFARPGETTIQVLVMGDASGGVYVVGATTDLGELLALAGGTQLGARQAGTVRTVDVRLLREQSGRRAIVYEASLQSMLSEPSAHPTLQDGDVLVVEAETRRSFGEQLRTTLQITTSLTSLILLADRVFGIF